MMRSLMFAFAVLLILSCEKDNGVTNPTVQERIVGNWNGVESEIVIFLPGGDQIIRQDLSFMTIDFYNDGTFISDSLGLPLDSGLWSAPDASTLVLDSLTFNIEILTSTHFSFSIDTSVTQGSTTVNATQTTKLAK